MQVVDPGIPGMTGCLDADAQNKAPISLLPLAFYTNHRLQFGDFSG